MPSPQSPADILAIAGAFRQSRVLLSGFDLGVFTVLGKGPATSAEVAKAVGADARGTDRLLDALVAMALLEKVDGRFRNTVAAARWLDEASPNCLTGLRHQSQLYRAWGTLTGAVRAGASVLDPERPDFSLEAFIEAMDRRARETAAPLVARLDLSGVGRVLDVGGGSAIFSIAFCRARDDLRATVMDLPDVVALTKRYVAAAGLEDRIDTRPGDFHEAPFGTGYDLVFFSAIVHMCDEAENRRLMAKAFAVLNPGGRIVIQDFVMDESRVHPADGALFALNMLVNTAGGDTYTEAEMRDWLSAAGCTRVAFDDDPRTPLVIGFKA